MGGLFLLLVVCIYCVSSFEREGAHFNCCNYYLPIAQQAIMAIKGDSTAWYKSLTKADPFVGHGPGPNTLMYYGWDDVVRIFRDWPRRIDNGTMKRHNELGITHFHDAPWSELGTIGTCISHEDHAVARPYIGRIADAARMPETMPCDGSNGWNRTWLRSLFRKRFAQIDEFKGSVVSVWISVLLHKVHFNMDVTDDDAKAFTSLRRGAALFSALPPRATCCPFLNSCIGIDRFNEKREAKVATFKDALRTKFAGEDWDDDKLAIVGNVFCDSILFAGGLSVTSLIQSMLALWFMDGRPESIDSLNLQDETSLRNFMFECVRRYSPVAGVSRWITNDDGENWEHEICNLRMANRDPRKFPDPLSFTPGRPGLNHKDSSLSCAWADQLLVNGDVCNPNSHSCPGKQLSQEIITAFMQEFLAAGPWEADAPEKCKVNDTSSKVCVLRKVGAEMQSA